MRMCGYADLRSGKDAEKIRTLLMHMPYAVSAHPHVTINHQSHY